MLTNAQLSFVTKKTSDLHSAENFVECKYERQRKNVLPAAVIM